MAKRLLTNELWERIEPLLTPDPQETQRRSAPRAGPGLSDRNRIHTRVRDGLGLKATEEGA